MLVHGWSRLVQLGERVPHHLRMGAFDGLEDRQRRFPRRARRVGLAEVPIGNAEIAERLAFAAAVADLPRDLEAGFVESDRLARVAEIGMGEAEIAERGAFAAAVDDLPGDLELCFVESDRFARVAEIGMGDAEIAERGARRSAAASRSSVAMALHLGRDGCPRRPVTIPDAAGAADGRAGRDAHEPQNMNYLHGTPHGS